jgi:NAD(P)-dependent dehydrogenase (short-subunit alcohol dehydrogenase family)
MRDADDLDEKTVDERLAETPLGRMGDPEEMAAAAAFLGSEDASFITGHMLVVDGGRTVT